MLILPRSPSKDPIGLSFDPYFNRLRFLFQRNQNREGFGFDLEHKTFYRLELLSAILAESLLSVIGHSFYRIYVFYLGIVLSRYDFAFTESERGSVKPLASSSQMTSSAPSINIAF